MRVVNLWQSSQYYCKITDVSHIFTLVHSNCVNVNALTNYLDNKQRSDLAFTSFFGQFSNDVKIGDEMGASDLHLETRKIGQFYFLDISYALSSTS